MGKPGGKDTDDKFDRSDASSEHKLGSTQNEKLLAEVEMLREQQRAQGKKLGELEQRFDSMDRHLGNLSELVKTALDELQQINTSQEKTTEKPE